MISPAPEFAYAAAPATVCVFLPNWVGDVVMATPALRALRRRFPTPTRIVGVMRPYVAEVLAGTQLLDDHLLWDRRHRQSELRTASVAPRLREIAPDLVVTLTNSFHSAWLAWRSGAKRRIGYARNFRSLLLTDRPPVPRDGWRARPWSAVDQYLTLAEAAGCAIDDRRVELGTCPRDEEGAEKAWRELDLFGRRVVLVNVGSATCPGKVWPQQHVVELCRHLSEMPDVSVLLICGPKERTVVMEIEQEVRRPRVVTMANQDLSLGVSKAVIRRADAMVTTDSGPRHIAAAFEIPTVTIFGSTIPDWSVNYSPVERWVSRDLACRPCARKECPYGHHACMRDLGVQQVLDAFLELPSRHLPVIQPTR